MLVTVFSISFLLSVFGNVETLETTQLEPWQMCDLFLAPSSTGWGVFAARDFIEGENVDVAPLVIRSSNSLAKNSVLDDYVYGYLQNPTGKYSTVVLYGYSMFFNHHPDPNVEYYMIGSGPIHTMGFRAKRAIRAGEQMFSTYGSEDGGAEWFKVRRMEMMAPKESIIPPQKLPQFMKDFCSNIHAQFGIPLWETLLIDGEGINSFGVNASRLAPFDSGLGNARAKQFISRGERVEIGPGLILSSKLTFGTALGSLVFPWNHLTEEQQASLRILREDGQLKLQHQGYDTSWKRVDTFESYEDLSILPVGGQIGLLRRVGEIESSNCRLNILWELGQPDSVTVILELVATDDIESGEILKLNLPQVGTMEELELLHAELVEFGHPFYAGIFDVRPEEDEL